MLDKIFNKSFLEGFNFKMKPYLKIIILVAVLLGIIFCPWLIQAVLNFVLLLASAVVLVVVYSIVKMMKDMKKSEEENKKRLQDI